MNVKEIVEAISDSQKLGFAISPKKVEKQINEHTNAKIKKIMEMTEELKRSEFSEVEINWNNALDEAILIIKSELIKTS